MSHSPFFHAHVHSQFSSLDALPKVSDLVQKAAKNRQPAISLTDHGNMAGAVKLYQASKQYGLLPFIGFEGYMIDPSRQDWDNLAKNAPKVERYHLGLQCVNEEGYKALVKFMTMTHTRPRFNRFPRFTLSDLAELGTEHGEDLILTTGCYFGLLQQTLVNEGPGRAKRVASMFAEWFPNTFVEVQNHHIIHPDGTTDEELVEALIDVANDVGLPIVGTQDSHYLHQQEKEAHALMKRMTYGGVEDEFPGDSFHLASTEWVQEHYTNKQWERIEEGCQAMLDLHDLHIEPLDNFRPDVPSMPGVKNPAKKVRKSLRKALDAYLGSIQATPSERQVYEDRMAEEDSVFDDLGMWAYLLFWLWFVEWCRDEEIAIEARGSANGSLICYLLGITQVDPIKWDVDFERFLSRDRIKPPDIDMDIEDVERPRALHKLLSMFESVQIGTWGRLGMTVDEMTGEEKGSVFQTWLSSKRRECEAIALKRYEAGKIEKKGDVKAYGQGIFNRTYGNITSIREVANVSKRDHRGLRQLSSMSAYRSYGVHAGGVLLSGDRVKIEDYVPTMLVASSDTKVSQYDMDDVEEFGLVKMDLLGQTTLSVMKVAQKLIGRSDPTDFSWIPEDDPKTPKLLREGRTETGIFHFEGYTKAKGGRELGVKSINDSILVHALYMPGPMDVAPGQAMSAKDHYVRARKDIRFRKSVTYPSPVFEKHLKPTYGAFVYQNQVLAILRDIGMDVATVNVFLKIVKDSGSGAVERNRERSEKVYKTYLRLAKKSGIKNAEELWGLLTTFAKYGFNKAHATGYGIRSYRCAYLKAHHQLEFMTALLIAWAGTKKELLYVREARRCGIRILPPHVNVSTDTWTIDYKFGAIRKGLVSIDGIGYNTAEPIAAGAPYKSIQDLIDRLPARVITGGKMYLDNGRYSGVLLRLRDAGALDGLKE